MNNFASIYVVLDAIDECSDMSRKEVLELIVGLQQSPNSRILISSRPHLRQILLDALKKIEVLDIYADEADLKNFITIKLRKTGIKDIKFEMRCLELAKGVQGM